MLENKMLVDSYWGEIEYGVPAPTKERLHRMREALEEEEREDGEDE